MDEAVQKILEGLPGKDCGECGFKTCAALAEFALHHPDAIRRCIYLERPSVPPPPMPPLPQEQLTWKDMLGREYDFILEQFPDDPGPRETILPFNPANAEKLGIKKGDILYGRPSAVACPVTHVGSVMEEPDYFNGIIVWCVVGQLAARQGGTEIGLYTPVAYEGIVRHAKTEPRIGQRHYFLPRTCMLQSRHSGVVTAMAKRAEGLRVRLEGIWIS